MRGEQIEGNASINLKGVGGKQHRQPSRSEKTQVDNGWVASIRDPGTALLRDLWLTPPKQSLTERRGTTATRRRGAAGGEKKASSR